MSDEGADRAVAPGSGDGLGGNGIGARPHDGVPLGGRDRSGDAQAPLKPERERSPLLDAVRAHRQTTEFLDAADAFMDAQGFTEHGRRHANLVGAIAHNVLAYLGHDPRTCELAAVAGYLHDIGNVVSRADHGQTGALIAMHALTELGVPSYDLAMVMSAVGNHEEEYGQSVSPISAAVILADKSDVHRSRVRKNASIEMDIHDRVNYAVETSFLRVDAEHRTLTLELTIDTEISQVLEYFEIFLERMIMCRRAAQTLGCDFKITVNDVPVL